MLLSWRTFPLTDLHSAEHLWRENKKKTQWRRQIAKTIKTTKIKHQADDYRATQGKGQKGKRKVRTKSKNMGEDKKK